MRDVCKVYCDLSVVFGRRQVHPILVTVVLDKQETETVRAAAFMVLKKSHPSFTTLQLIAHSLRTEQSRQIKTLIYSSLVNLASFRSHIPELLATCVSCHPRFLFLFLPTTLLKGRLG